MNCLCCGKPLTTNTEMGWHKRCIKRFFGTTVLPHISISETELQKIADESVGKGLTVPGVQKKLSLHLFSDTKEPRLTIVNYRTGYILKPQVTEYPSMPEAEHLVMSMAEVCGIKTVPHALIEGEKGYYYITKRIDRNVVKKQVNKLAMEDFCQLDLHLTQDKYRGSYERCSKVISRYSSHNALDQTEFFIRLVFCFITGNSDMHLKNFSLIETSEGSLEYVLSPAYDLLPVNLLLPEDKEQMALTVNGKKTNIRKEDFLILADHAEVKREVAERLISSLLAKEKPIIQLCQESLLPEDMKQSFIDLIQQRCAVFQ